MRSFSLVMVSLSNHEGDRGVILRQAQDDTVDR
jgi:hypothetical protein